MSATAEPASRRAHVAEKRFCRDPFPRRGWYPPAMDPLIPKVAVILAIVALIAIRAPHGHRSRLVKVATSYKGTVEVLLLVLAWVGFIVPVLWLTTSALDGAEYPLHRATFAAGVACLVSGLWMFHRSHKDLGTNWSITLEVREQHVLVTEGVYRHVRHPMYTALFLYSIGLALILPNWIAGPSYLTAFTVLFAFRIGAEERMMRATFGQQYADYEARTKRLIPSVW